jgi:hypothetical protein
VFSELYKVDTPKKSITHASTGIAADKESNEVSHVANNFRPSHQACGRARPIMIILQKNPFISKNYA